MPDVSCLKREDQRELSIILDSCLVLERECGERLDLAELEAQLQWRQGYAVAAERGKPRIDWPLVVAVGLGGVVLGSVAAIAVVVGAR